MSHSTPSLGLLLRGVDEVVHAALVPEFSTRSAFLSLKHLSQVNERAEATVRAMLDAMDANFPLIVTHPQRLRSKENWRLDRLNDTLALENSDPEIVLERSFIRACKAVGRADWWNQVPVSSGLEGRYVGKGRAIDLVHRRSAHAFDFVELKVESNNPLYAAVEIIQYGLIWLLSRIPSHRQALGQEHRSLLDADDVALCVLAPQKFYANENLHDLEVGINNALIDIGAKRGASMTFRFEQFQDDIDIRNIRACDDQKLLALFDGRATRHK